MDMKVGVKIGAALDAGFVSTINKSQSSFTQLKTVIDSTANAIGATEKYAQLDTALTRVEASATQARDDVRSYKTQLDSVKQIIAQSTASQKTANDEYLNAAVAHKAAKQTLADLTAAHPIAKKRTQEQRDAINAAKAALTDQSKALRAAKAALTTSNKALKDNKTAYKSLTKQHKDAQANLKIIDSQVKSVSVSFNEQQRVLRDMGINTDDVTRSNKALHSSLQTLQSDYKKLQTAEQRYKQAKDKKAKAHIIEPVAQSAFALSPVAVAVKQAVTFESSLADVSKVTNIEGTQLQELGNDILALSTTVPVAANKIADAITVAGQSGRIAKDELLGFARDTAVMSVAFDVEGDEAASAIIGLRGQFKLSQADVILASDAYNHLSNNMDATAAGMLRVTNRTAATGQLIGLNAQQVGALSATFLALKTPPEVAATGMNAMFQKLATADKQSKKFQTALRGIGYSATELKDALKDDAQATIIDFLDTIKSSDDVVGTLADLFGAEYADDISKLVGGLDDYKKALALVANEQAYAGSMQAEYAKRSQTTANNLQLTRNQFNRLGVTIGTTLLPAVNDLIGSVSPYIEQLSALAAAHPELTKIVLGTVAGLATLRVATAVGSYAFGALNVASKAVQFALAKQVATTASVNAATRINTVTASAAATANNSYAAAANRAGFAGRALRFGRLATTALSAVGAVGALASGLPAVSLGISSIGAAMLANPIGLVIAAIAGGALVVRKYWEPLTTMFGGFWNGLKDGLAPLAPAFKPVVEMLDNVGEKLAYVKQLGADAFEWVSEILDPVELSENERESLTDDSKSVGYKIGSFISSTLGFDDETQTIKQVVEPVKLPTVEEQSQTISQSLHLATLPDTQDQVQQVEQRLLATDLPTVEEQSQTISQSLNLATLPDAQDQVQQVEQRLLATDLPTVEDQSQTISQSLHLATLPDAQDQVQQVEQRLLATDLPTVEEQSQTISQSLNLATLPDAQDQVQQVEQRLLATDLPTVEEQSQTISQSLHLATLPDAQDQVQQVEQRLLATDLPTVEDQSQTISQSLHLATLPDAQDQVQQVEQRLLATDLPTVEDQSQTISQSLHLATLPDAQDQVQQVEQRLLATDLPTVEDQSQTISQSLHLATLPDAQDQVQQVEQRLLATDLPTVEDQSQTISQSLHLATLPDAQDQVQQIEQRRLVTDLPAVRDTHETESLALNIKTSEGREKQNAQITVNNTFHITTLPHQDAQEIAEQVIEIIEDKDVKRKTVGLYD